MKRLIERVMLTVQLRLCGKCYVVWCRSVRIVDET